METDAAELGHRASLVTAGLLAGALSHAEVIAWADRTIAEIESPPRWLLELSMSSGAHRELDRVKLLLSGSSGCERDKLAPIAMWREVVGRGRATAWVACQQLAECRLPAGPRRRLAELARAYEAAPDDSARACVTENAWQFLLEYGGRSAHSERVAAIMAY